MATKKKASKKKTAAKRPPRGRQSAKAKSRRPATARPKRAKRPARARKRTGRVERFIAEDPEATRGLGPEAAGQSGDIEGLSREELADSESVEELVEEGQAFEAGIVSGVENAADADRGEVRTKQVPEDDVPQEYLDED